MDAFEFFYDDSVEDFVPVIKLNLTSVEVGVETQQINVDWTQEAVDDLTAAIDRDIIARLIEMGVDANVNTEAGEHNWNNEEL